MSSLSCDVLVIGSGVGGLTFALKAARFADVILITKKESMESATNYAQGGIASVVAPDDTLRLHVEDTLTAGAGLCHEDAVRLVVERGPECIRRLMEWGIDFTRERNQLSLGREGGHSRSRIVHFADHTGREVERVLTLRVRDVGRIRELEHHLAIDLLVKPKVRAGEPVGDGIRCFGAYVLDTKKDEVKTILARAVVLASGGTGVVYYHTTNPAIATGDGIAMAWRAGAQVGNLEFMQFHPTALYESHGMADERRFLISEAVRGFGAILRTTDGEPFMEHYHPQKDLAPRDIVARAIDAEMKKRGDEFVVLDCTHLPASALRERFPHIYETCLARGLDMTNQPIPVVPAAHYMCGGVVTDLVARTNIGGLFAVGEVAMTGVHGANRLASNSLLEAVVFADQATSTCQEWLSKRPAHGKADAWSDEGTINQEEWVLISHDRQELQRLMWDYVGIVRSDFRLHRVEHRVRLLEHEIMEFYWRTKVTEPLIELRNLALVARLIVHCALSRRESRGLHFTTDYPDRNDAQFRKDTILSYGSLSGNVQSELPGR
ncbi:MAG: L-aspartate oxidase [bacterium]